MRVGLAEPAADAAAMPTVPGSGAAAAAPAPERRGWLPVFTFVASRALRMLWAELQGTGPILFGMPSSYGDVGFWARVRVFALLVQRS